MNPARSHTYAELRANGFSRADIRRELARGSIVRVRRGRYTRADTGDAFVRAGGRGGRLDCLSLLQELGVFVLAAPDLHVQLDRESSRVPSSADGIVRHWRSTNAADGDLAADLVEALAQSCRCQAPRAAIATLDSAWHLGLVDEPGLAAVFARLPARYAALRPHLDSRSEAGTETLVRLMLRALGCSVDLQVKIDGVGRVDLVVDGWLIVECDSRKHHGTPEDQLRDRRRDLAAAERGFVTFRVLAESVLFHPERVLAALRALIAVRPTR